MSLCEFVLWRLKDTVCDDNLPARLLTRAECDTLYWFTHGLLAVMPMVPLHVSGVCVCLCVVIAISSYCVLKCMLSSVTYNCVATYGTVVVTDIQPSQLNPLQE